MTNNNDFTIHCATICRPNSATYDTCNYTMHPSVGYKGDGRVAASTRFQQKAVRVLCMASSLCMMCALYTSYNSHPPAPLGLKLICTLGCPGPYSAKPCMHTQTRFDCAGMCEACLRLGDRFRWGQKLANCMSTTVNHAAILTMFAHVRRHSWNTECQLESIPAGLSLCAAQSCVLLLMTGPICTT